MHVPFKLSNLMMCMQVEGKDGFAKLMKKVRTSGVRVLYHGSLAAWAATFVGHWPWFAVVRCYGRVSLSKFPCLHFCSRQGRCI